ncbi:class I SAM-dependent RNA methyltransferase [Nannocystis pusilla]|uniref:class I SAM-dependent RNA methyltransferase n=1 Tax=Nannocystis pusilla TaxID=889268 RepID=UPI003DA548B0
MKTGATEAAEAAAGERVEVRGIAHGGEGVGRAVGDGADTRTWLVEGALPGEQVLAVRSEERRRMIRGRTLQVLTPSPDRVTPPCPVEGVCGGCGLQHARAAAQAELKRQIAEGALRRLGIAVPHALASPRALGYRRRARLHVERVGDEVRLGLHRRHSHEVLALAHCPVFDAPLNHALARLAALAGGAGGFSQVLRQLRRGEVHLLSDGAAVVVGIPGLAPREGDADEAGLRAALAEVLDNVIVGVVARGGRRELVVGRGRLALADAGPEDMAIPTGPFEFAQAQAAQNRALVERVVALADARGGQVLELFAGGGNFTRALAREAAEVVAVEEDRGSASALLRLAKKALASRQAKVEVRRLDATRALGRYAAEGRSFDRVVLDPPRSGLGLHGARALARVASGRTVFVACDPATLARDLEPMLEAGHRAASALAIDMMPMTPEVEVIVALDAPRERS